MNANYLKILKENNLGFVVECWCRSFDYDGYCNFYELHEPADHTKVTREEYDALYMLCQIQHGIENV